LHCVGKADAAGDEAQSECTNKVEEGAGLGGPHFKTFFQKKYLCHKNI